MEMIKTERLVGWGTEAARSIPITGTVSGKKTARRLRAAMQRVGVLSRQDSSCAWYADNEYLARREGSNAVEAFCGVSRLRRTQDGAALVALCRKLLEAGPVSEDRLGSFLAGARQSEELPENEASIIGAGLRMAIILELAEGADTERAAELFTSLRTLAGLDLTEVLERSDPVDALLRQDEIYPLMDEQSRSQYRARCQALAKKHGATPLKEAQTALDAGLHDYLFPSCTRTGAGYIAVHLLATVILSLVAGFASGTLWTAVLAALPLSELIRSVMDAVLLRFVRPLRLPRLALENGVGAAGRTVCAVSSLLTDAESGAALAKRLEEYRLANRDCGEDLLFALLADLPDSKTYPIADGKARLSAAQSVIDSLNVKWGGGFYLLTREPRWNAADQTYAPWERKRGAVLELARLVQGQDSELTCLSGDLGQLRARYILCLDADTRLVPGSAKAMIGAAMHPVSTPVIQGGVVVKGHGVLHPRMSVELSCALATDFSKLYAGQGGTDPYGAPTGELFSDLYGRGGFSGKGVVDAAAYLECLDGRFGDNRILSHDTLEGAYLRGGYMGDVELTDCAPVNAGSWFRRMHRWTRGDWQNLPWLFREGRALSLIDRWHIFDNLRHSLFAPAVFAAIVLSLFLPGLRAAAVIAIVCLGAEAVHEAFAGLFSRTSDVRLRCRSGVLRGLGGSFTRLLVRLIFLPWEAGVCAGAIVAALWRMGVSHKNMLQWVPSAQSGGRRLPGGLLFSTLTGAALALLAPGPAGKALGIVWLFTPALSWATGLQSQPKNELTDGDRRFLLSSAEAIWGYFTDLCTRSDHWLPPDNFQVQPPKGVAHRTSPTNIGLAIASAVSAMDLGIASGEDAALFIDRIMSTIERLPKWRGHLYNWYDTNTGAPLQPAYVSTVDSGNLCACLICAANALAAHGCRELSDRVAAFADNIDLAALYDEKKRLFRIGFDPSADKVSPGHYDLMASEARLTSYLACARGEVPLRHWQALSRAQLSLDGWRGLASWSGSMFEYLMPELFLPLINGSMLWETGRFCLYAQRRRGAMLNVPWGNSESAFFSLDAGMDYRYKAHGTGALALRGDVNSELVVAPYASFLALCVHPKAAVKNLRRLKKRGVWGTYGFYEALDLTPGRTPQNGETVACFMSHHLGMSLCAAANCLSGGALRRYFMADTACAAYKPLLAERVPLGGAVLRRSQSPLSRPPESRPDRAAYLCQGEGYAPGAPAFFPLSNGVYSLLAASDGSCRALAGGLLMYRPDGFELTVNETPVTPSRRLGAYMPWRFEGGSVMFTAGQTDAAVSTTISVASGECGELRSITGPSGGRLCLRFEPVLTKPDDFRSHPAFWRLGLEVSARSGAVFVRRLSRGSLPEVWLCLAGTMRLTVESGAGWQMNDPVIIGATLPDGGCGSLAVCFAQSRDEAYAGARRILTGGTADMAASMAALLGMTTAGIQFAFDLGDAICANRVASRKGAVRERLWQHGISGDLPIVYVAAEDENLGEAKRTIKRHALLTACGLRSDLVIAAGEAGDYLHPKTETLRRYLDKYGLACFLGEKGGIHFCDSEDVKAAAVLIPEARGTQPLLSAARHTAERNRIPPAVSFLGSGAVCYDTPPLPPRAWSNVLTNGHFGYLAADCGTGFMWLENARECPVNPWCNDPIATVSGETLELVTAEGRRSLFADGMTPCKITNGFGWTRWEQEGVNMTAFVPAGYKARVLIIEGGSGAYLNWHLPLTLTPNAADAPFVISSLDGGCLAAENPRSLYPNELFRAVSNHGLAGFTGDEAAWLANDFDKKLGAGLRPCFGALWKTDGMAVIVCGYEDAETLKALAEPDRAAQELLRVRDGWRTLLGRVHIQTPDENLDRMMNGWAAYQTIGCRILGRTSMYQSGGAYGYRDQLQDVLNIVFLAPERAKRHILTCCARQFREGDVLHWWHETPEGPKGVRTRCSDDLLWLPWALCEYTEKTGNLPFCREEAAWLDAPPLRPDENDRYFTPVLTGTKSAVLDHARRALDCVLTRGHGSHGLLCTGSGDWNDGMDKVGGESVWLTWFFIHTASRFADLLDRLGEPDGVKYRDAAVRYTTAAERAWDGGWYLRGFWQDGAPLGAASSPACSIDSVAQSWAAFCPGANQRRVRTALRACMEQLHDEAHGVTKLFSPPFEDAGRDPGYIRSCGPGFRENGGQYTHGALWLASALLKEGFTDDGSIVLLSLLPARHTPAQWGAEPYVLAADVSANADHYGEALWSWYTGSSGWFFRVVLEDLLGITLKDGQITVDPHLPSGWEGYEADVGGRHIKVWHGKVTIT